MQPYLVSKNYAAVSSMLHKNIFPQLYHSRRPAEGESGGGVGQNPIDFKVIAGEAGEVFKLLRRASLDPGSVALCAYGLWCIEARTWLRQSRVNSVNSFAFSSLYIFISKVSSMRLLN